MALAKRLNKSNWSLIFGRPKTGMMRGEGERKKKRKRKRRRREEEVEPR